MAATVSAEAGTSGRRGRPTGFHRASSGLYRHRVRLEEARGEQGGKSEVQPLRLGPITGCRGINHLLDLFAGQVRGDGHHTDRTDRHHRNGEDVVAGVDRE